MYLKNWFSHVSQNVLCAYCTHQLTKTFGTLLLKSQSVHQSKPIEHAAKQYATLMFQRRTPVSTRCVSDLHPNADTGSSCLCRTFNKLTSLTRAMSEGVHLHYDTAFHLNLNVQIWAAEHANCRMFSLFYALTCMSATVCKLTAAVRYIVANLHYACHIVE